MEPHDRAEDDYVRVWRPDPSSNAVWMESLSQNCRADMQMYSIGYVARRGIHIRRGADRYRLRPGDLTVWSPGTSHRGAPLDDGPWLYRSVALGLPELADVVADPDDCVVDLPFPNPVVDDRELADRFVRLHADATRPASLLERQSTLAVWLQDLAARSPSASSLRLRQRQARNDPALLRACEHMREDPTRNVGLDDLATVAGTSKFRLIRLFKTALGVAPHTYQIAIRVQQARRLLEAGVAAGEVAFRTGFVDQSHLNRHFTRRVGLTPGAYARAVGGTPARPAAGPPSPHSSDVEDRTAAR